MEQGNLRLEREWFPSRAADRRVSSWSTSTTSQNLSQRRCCGPCGRFLSPGLAWAGRAAASGDDPKRPLADVLHGLGEAAEVGDERIVALRVTLTDAGRELLHPKRVLGEPDVGAYEGTHTLAAASALLQCRHDTALAALIEDAPPPRR